MREGNGACGIVQYPVSTYVGFDFNIQIGLLLKNNNNKKKKKERKKAR